MPTYDLFSPTFKANPFPTYAAMRQHDPIYAHTAPNGQVSWYFTRYADVVDVLKDNDTFVKDFNNTRDPVPAKIKGQQKSLQRMINDNMLFADPPDHTRLRALVNLAFTPKRVAALESSVWHSAETLLQTLHPHGHCDLINAFALPFPVIVICDLLGIPKADQPQVAEWAQVIISPSGKGLVAKQRKQQMKAFVAYLHDIFAERRAAPQDDLISDLVSAETAGDKLNEAELSSMIALLLVTGHETTINLIGNSIYALLQHPDQLNLLKNNPALLDDAVEELLRFDGPVETSTTRWVRRDCTYKGHAMQRGDVVRAVITAANRDPAIFDEPDRLNLLRGDKRHLQFGQGIHYCLGAPLARLEAKVALKTVFELWPELRLGVSAENLKWRSGVLFRGLETLPVHWK